MQWAKGCCYFLFGFHGLICKYFEGGGPKIYILGEIFNFWLDGYTVLYFFQKLWGGGEGVAHPNVGQSLSKMEFYTYIYI